ncbi:LytR C-terminal domain-containing protein [Patescibacteria group bacterium]
MPKSPARKKKTPKKGSNKRVSKKKKIRQEKLKKFLTIFSLVFLSATFLSGYLFYKKITQEYASAFSTSSRDLLSKELYSSAFIVVDNFDDELLLVRKLSLYVFDKSTLKTIVYEIPVDIVIDAPGRFGEEPLSNILALGTLDNESLSEGGHIVANSIFKLFAFPVDRYMLVESEAESAIESLYNGRLEVSSSTDILQLKEMIFTDHTLRELFDIYKFASSLPQDRILHTQIGESYLSNPSLLDEELMDLTFDLVLSKEKKSIAVLNGTEESGVATFGTRVIRNFGGRVVATGNTRDSYENSILIVDDLTAESTRIISEIFGIDNIILYSDIRGFSESEVNRSDITIIFGLDFAGLL